MEVIDVTFPCAMSVVVEATETMLDRYNTIVEPSSTNHTAPSATGKSKDKRVRMVVVDSIASNPGSVAQR